MTLGSTSLLSHLKTTQQLFALALSVSTNLDPANVLGIKGKLVQKLSFALGEH